MRTVEVQVNRQQEFLELRGPQQRLDGKEQAASRARHAGRKPLPAAHQNRKGQQCEHRSLTDGGGDNSQVEPEPFVPLTAWNGSGQNQSVKKIGDISRQNHCVAQQTGKESGEGQEEDQPAALLLCGHLVAC